jgi:hypothetical protein
MKPLTVLLMATALLLTAGEGTTSAGLISFTYNTVPNVSVISADLPGTGGITLTNEPGYHVTGATKTILTNLGTFSSTPASNPDRITSQEYSISLNLYDEASRTAGTLTFTGAFDGTISAKDAQITNSFLAPTTQSLLLGENLYTVTLSSFTPPGPPNAKESGSIAAQISVAAQGSEDEPREASPVNHVPEPSSLVLMGLGAVILAGRRVGPAFRRDLRRAS